MSRRITANEARERVRDAWPRQWWRQNGCGLKDGKFHCPCCGERVPVRPFCKGLVIVPPHRIARRSRCMFSNHIEPAAPITSPTETEEKR